MRNTEIFRINERRMDSRNLDGYFFIFTFDMQVFQCYMSLKLNERATLNINLMLDEIFLPDNCLSFKSLPDLV